MSLRRCRKCGLQHPRCSGHKKLTDPPQPCMAWPVPGGRACRMHGGATKTAKQAAERARREQQARDLAARHAIDRRLDPVDGMLEHIARVAGRVDWLRAQVHALDPDAIVHGKLSTKVVAGAEGGITETSIYGPGVHLWWKLYTEADQDLFSACADATRAGLHARQIELAERQGELVGRMLRQVLDDLQLPTEQRARANEIVRASLHLLRPGA